MIFCKDCKFFRKDFLDPQKYSLCIHPNNTSTYDGSIVPKFADLERSSGPCGRNGSRFELKESA